MTTAFTTHLRATATNLSCSFLARSLCTVAILVVALLLLTSGSAQAAATNRETSVDLYCKSLSFGFIETYRYLNKKRNETKLEDTGIAMEKTCRNAPSVAPVAVSDMTRAQIDVISCMGFATGAQLAHQVGQPTEPYGLLNKRREFALNACQAKPKQFQDDVFKHGPDYVLKQKY